MAPRRKKQKKNQMHRCVGNGIVFYGSKGGGGSSDQGLGRSCIDESKTKSHNWCQPAALSLWRHEETDRYTEGQTDRQPDRQTDRQTDIHSPCNAKTHVRRPYLC